MVARLRILRTYLDGEGQDVRMSSDPVKLTRAGALWSALIVGFVILILLLVFIAQNTQSVNFAFLTWRWSLPLGVAILLAAVAGGLVTVAVGTARIVQLRRVTKKHMAALADLQRMDTSGDQGGDGIANPV
jgi:uncharacterized integral membrane protein